MRQQVYLDSRFGQVMNGGGTLLWMHDPIVLPSMKHAFNLSVSFVAMPLAHYVITEANRRLHIVYMHVAPHAPLIIDLPMENHSIDEMVEVLNRNLLFRFTAGYSENTNTLHFSTANFSASLVIGPLTTGGDLIGFAPETRTSSGRTTRPAASTWRAPPHSTYAPASGRGTGTPATWAIPP